MEKNSAIFLHQYGVPDKPLPDMEWVIVRNYEMFVQCITEYLNEHEDFPPIIVIDCPLADEHISWFVTNLGKIPQFDKFRNKTGFHAASFIMQLSDMLIQPPHKIIINGTGMGNETVYNVLNKWKEVTHKTFDLHKIKYELKAKEK